MYTDIKETRQGVGYPDWQIVKGSERMFDYSEDTTTELMFDDDIGTAHLVVLDRTRQVWKYQYTDGSMVNLYRVSGLVRRFYGSSCYGHTEWYVAID